MKGSKKFLFILFGVIVILILIIAGAFLLSSLGIFVSPVTNLDTYKEEYPVVVSKARVCILYYETEFKKKLISALVDELNEKDISVVVDQISNRGSYTASDYDAVILLSGVMKFSPIPEVTQYIRKNKYLHNIVYFVSYEAVNVPYGYKKVINLRC
jgi:hypothetical protein